MAKMIPYVHCDVFATKPYTGNSLAVFMDAEDLSGDNMLALTQELRHFESVFLSKEEGGIRARVFDLFEELPFAGHPLIGAACALHRKSDSDVGENVDHTLYLQDGREVSIETYFDGETLTGSIDQGRPEFLSELPDSRKADFAKVFNVDAKAMSDLPLTVISTGLKYLVVPVTGGLPEARITVDNLEELLKEIGAEYAYVLDVERMEGRHWNNDGIMEDVATGSAAGVVGAYLLQHTLQNSAEEFILRQGHFMGRPSELYVTPYGEQDAIEKVVVSGNVAFVGTGELVRP